MMFVVLAFLLGIFEVSQAACPLGYTHSNDSIYEPNMCYLSVDIPTDWYTAREKCLEIPGGHLVYVKNKNTNVFMQGIVLNSMNDTTTNRWLGAYRVEDGWIWQDDTQMLYHNWALYEPREPGRCLSMNATTGQWNATECSKKLPYTCAALDSGKAVAANVMCDSGWTYFDGSKFCYRVFFNQNQSLAQNVCQIEGANLTSIHDALENQFVRNLAMAGYDSTSMTFAIWLGGISQNGTTYTWTDGTTFDYMNWKTGEPSKYPCVGMYTDYPANYGKWFAYLCSYPMRAYVCKKPANSSSN